AEFSPEWQAIQYGLQHNIPVRFMDLPQSHQMAERIAQEKRDFDSAQPPGGKQEGCIGTAQPLAERSLKSTETGIPRTEHHGLKSSETVIPVAERSRSQNLSQDPLGYLAKAAGYTDRERWWEHMVEQRQDSTELFEAILEAMGALREESEKETPPDVQNNPRHRREAQREAYMRKTIRKAQKEGFQNIAVVCGAWHSPALTEPFPTQKHDNALLKGLPKVKVKATWIPWTYARLSKQSGYGAGIDSPGWYEHLWKASQQSQSTTVSSIQWLTKVARLLRGEDLDASSASVIETVRLAEALASIRDAAMPGLEELTEATQTVLCFGDATPLKLIEQKLIISDRLGQVPESTPLIPLQQDLQKLQKKLRMRPEASDKLLTLDLRKELDLARSHLLHRLSLLNIRWGFPKRTSGKGTFKEAWQLRWEPELSLAIIEAGCWGNTVMNAASAYTQQRADNCKELPELTQLLEPALLANLPDAIAHLMRCLQNAAAIAHDVTHLMAALPPLANILRYRDVRQTDTDIVATVVDGLVARLCIGLPGACASLDDEAAQKMLSAIAQTHSAIKLLQQPHHAKAWSAVLRQLCDQSTLHGLLAGHSCRLLLDEGSLTGDEAARRLGLALSLANEPTQAAAWVEGFLQGSGLLLLHDNTIWHVLDDWITTLSSEAFITLVPLLRRTFSNFSAPERRQMGERVRTAEQPVSALASSNGDFDQQRADASLNAIAQLLGLPTPQKEVTP
ncbi:MAG: DUF5682 family protein, partial [Cyanobacteria bacterium J06598_1]